MQAIEQAQKWYHEQLFPAIKEDLPETIDCIAVGISGRGSECFGFDDEVSRDHDFNCTATVWLTQEDDRKFGFELTRLYNRVCKATPGNHSAQSSLLGDSERGVVVIEDFLLRHLGFAHVPATFQQWLYTPEHAFAETVNGRIFHDGPGTFTRIREDIRHGMPEDIRLKKIAAHTVMAAQSGQYNYSRCLKHGEPGAAAIALGDFIRHAAHLVHLLNFTFTPYYKWMLKSMKNLPLLGELAFELEKLPDTENKQELIEKICSQIADELRREDLSSSKSDYLEPHAFDVMSHIRSRQIKALHIMEC